VPLHESAAEQQEAPPSHEKFGMTPFDQQNAQRQYMSESHYQQRPPIDQKIGERESLRHSTHRS